MAGQWRGDRDLLAQVGPQMSDAELVARCKAHDAQAFALLWARYRGSVAAVCRARLGPGPDADDASQDTFLVALRRLNEFEGGELVERWLRRIASLCCAGVARRRRTGARRLALAEPAVLVEMVDPGASSGYEAVMDTVVLNDLLSSLDPRDAALLRARYLQDQPVSEIAARHRMTPGSTRVALHRALQRARRQGDRGWLVLPVLGRLQRLWHRRASLPTELTPSLAAAACALTLSVAAVVGVPTPRHPPVRQHEPQAAMQASRTPSGGTVGAPPAPLHLARPAPVASPDGGAPQSADAHGLIHYGEIELPAGRRVDQEPPSGEPDYRFGVPLPHDDYSELFVESYQYPEHERLNEAACDVVARAEPAAYCERRP